VLAKEEDLKHKGLPQAFNTLCYSHQKDRNMPTAVRALGEVALRVNDLDRSQAFYADVIGLPLLRRMEHAVFFSIAEGYHGHTAILALFDRQIKVDQALSTIDHIAFTIDRSDYDSEKQRLESLGYTVQTAFHDWVNWRSLYIRDPDGNNVELVCHDSPSQ
jgi:catechol-2,3-dioxygenase